MRVQAKKISHTHHGNKATKAVITECAWAASGTKDTFISSRYKRLTGRRGKKKALVATGNQLLKIVCHMLKNKTHYKELGADYVDNRRKSHLIRHHLDALKGLGVDMPGALSAQGAHILRPIFTGTPKPEYETGLNSREVKTIASSMRMKFQHNSTVSKPQNT